ncbi:hypothetical protein ACFY1B_48335 [Streptomyces mirabilis]|uniref:hypothetical protein n=1 Tax=Streptomyces mirabilis TaxID=68239 RepID=UPI003686317C
MWTEKAHKRWNETLKYRQAEVDTQWLRSFQIAATVRPFGQQLVILKLMVVHEKYQQQYGGLCS